MTTMMTTMTMVMTMIMLMITVEKVKQLQPRKVYTMHECHST